MRNRETLMEYAEKIKSLGYTVFVAADKYGCFGYVINDNDQVGYFQLDDWGTGVLFSTVHKPCRDMGCGISCDNWDEGHSEITREIVDRSFMVTPPGYRCSSKKRAMIKKWSAKEWLEARNKENLVELTLI